MLLTLFALSRIIHPNNTRSVNKRARANETNSVCCCCCSNFFFPCCRAAPVPPNPPTLSLSLTLPVLSLYTNSNHSPRFSQEALFRQDVLCERVCFRLCVAMNAVFVTLLALPRAWITSLQEEKEGNEELREEKKRRCVTERKKEPLMKSEVREGERESLKLKQNMWRTSCYGAPCDTNLRAMCVCTSVNLELPLKIPQFAVRIKARFQS